MNFKGRSPKTELSIDTCVEKCPYCGYVNMMVGFANIFAYTCEKCGEGREARTLTSRRIDAYSFRLARFGRSSRRL
jgi:hypothetical protein